MDTTSGTSRKKRKGDISMKKVLAMLIALMMVVALSAATVVISDAAEPATPTVAGPASKVFVTIGGVETEMNATTNQLTAGSGTIKFDAATGTITLENATGIEKVVTKPNITEDKATPEKPVADNGAGSVIIEVKGTNTIASASAANEVANKNTLWIYDLDGHSGEGVKTCNLTIKGNGTLNVTGYQYVLGTQAGNTEITGDVTLNVTSHGQDAIHIGANGSFYGHDFIVSGNAKVNATTSGTSISYIYRNGNGKGYFVVKDNADVKLTNPSTKSWGSALRGAGLKVLGGKLTVEVAGPANQQSIVAIDLQGIGLDRIVSEVSGGKVVAKATSNFSTGDPRANTLFMKNVGGFKISGGVVELEASNAKAHANPAKPASNGCIAFQGTVVEGFSMTGGELKMTSNDNVYGAFSPSVADMPINISGGKITGSGNNFIFTYANKVALNITGGTIEYAAKNGIIGHYESHDLPVITGSAAKVQAKLVETAGTLSVTAADFATTPGTPGTVPPPTSDFAPIACVALGVMAMAAAAVVVIRKKVNG